MRHHAHISLLLEDDLTLASLHSALERSGLKVENVGSLSLRAGPLWVVSVDKRSAAEKAGIQVFGNLDAVEIVPKCPACPGPEGGCCRG